MRLETRDSAATLQSGSTASRSDARVEIPPRFPRAWSIAPFLREHGPAPHHPGAGASTLGRRGLLNHLNAFH
jgi:hypothetical protein